MRVSEKKYPDVWIMSICTSCGTVLAPGSQFCNTCGLPLMTVPASAMVPPSGTQRAITSEKKPKTMEIIL